MQVAQHNPLHRHKLFETDDLDEARDIVARVFCPHKLDLFGRKAFSVVHNRADLGGGLSLNYIQYGADVRIDPGQLGNFYLLQIPMTGHARVKCGVHRAEASPSVGTLLSPTQHVDMEWSWDCRKLLVQIGKDRVERCLEAMLGRSINRAIDFDLAFEMRNGPGDSIVRLIDCLRYDLDSGAGALSTGLAGAQINEALITSLLKTQRHSYSEALETGGPGIAPRHIRRAEAHMREHLAEAIDLGDIAMAAGVSTRALQEGFRRFRDTSPLEMLRSLRMDAVRAELLLADPHETVTTIALRWGFGHLSRFSGNYRARYHETPSETLRRGGGHAVVN